MKKIVIRKKSILILGILLLVGMVATGCGTKKTVETVEDKTTASGTDSTGNTVSVTNEDTSSNTDTSNNADTASGEVRKVIIGTGTSFKPYCYLDENGKLAGYEYEVLSAVDELLPQYEFEFQTFEFANILVGIDAKKIDVGAHQFELNEERQEKYLFTNESYTTFILRITVDKNRNDIKSLDDLQGKNVQTGTGSNASYILEQYNKDHADNPINLIYSSETSEQQVNNIANGTYDAIISITRVVDNLNKEFGDHLKTVGESIANSNTYFVFNKDDVQLRDDIDGALKTLKESGKLAEISIKIIGGDYTTND
jgi:L-cystine transport system substrate-binding protein